MTGHSTRELVEALWVADEKLGHEELVAVWHQVERLAILGRCRIKCRLDAPHGTGLYLSDSHIAIPIRPVRRNGFFGE